MTINFSDLESAVDFVSWGQLYEHSACVRRSTGEIFYQSELAGEDEYPDDYESHPEAFVELPHKRELELGQSLVWEFVDQEMPQFYPKIESFFRRKGAYSRYKSFLEGLGLLDKWYEFELCATQKALREWCKLNELEVKEGE